VSKCNTCGDEYHREGGVMISICSECLAYPSAPDGFISVNGIMRPNPAYVEWMREHNEYLAAKKHKRSQAA
jgi:hypothetical protein